MVNRLETLRETIDRLIWGGDQDADLGCIRLYLSHMYGTARFCTLLAMKRNLCVELATTCGVWAWHDIV